MGHCGKVEDKEKELIKAAGLGYSYTSLEEQVKKTLSEAVCRVLDSNPLRHSGTLKERNVSAEFRKKDPRHSVNTAASIKLDHLLMKLATEKKTAEQVVTDYEQTVQQASSLATLIDRYALTLQAVQKTLENGPNLKEPPRATTATAVSSRVGVSAPPKPIRQSSMGGNTALANTNSCRPSGVERMSVAPNRKTGKAKVPPKPVPQPVTEEEFLRLSTLVRDKIKLEDVNQAYDVLFRAFVDENLESITIMELAKRGVKTSGRTDKAKITVLRTLKRINVSCDQTLITPQMI